MDAEDAAAAVEELDFAAEELETAAELEDTAAPLALTLPEMYRSFPAGSSLTESPSGSPSVEMPGAPVQVNVSVAICPPGAMVCFVAAVPFCETEALINIGTETLSFRDASASLAVS